MSGFHLIELEKSSGDIKSFSKSNFIQLHFTFLQPVRVVLPRHELSCE